MFFNVSVVSPKKVIFKGQAKSIVVPGEQGVFEVLPFHKQLLSRLISGILLIDGQEHPIKRGAIKISKNVVTVIVEET